MLEFLEIFRANLTAVGVAFATLAALIVLVSPIVVIVYTIDPLPCGFLLAFTYALLALAGLVSALEWWIR